MDKTTTRLVLAAAIAAFAAGTASAQGAAGLRGPLGDPDFAVLDTNGDGHLTTEDFSARRDARFAEIDTDGDGSVDEREFVAHAVARATERAAEMFSRLDADGDGSLSRDVLERGRGGGRRMGTRLIERFDADGSGGLSRSEFDTAMAEIGSRRGDRGGRPRGFNRRH